jgi:DNA polymerase elongation subunit (family B)
MNIPIYTENCGKGKMKHVFANDDGERCVEIVEFKATMYEASNEPTGWVSTDGYNVAPFICESADEYVKEHENIRHMKYFGDIQNKYQFLRMRYPDEIKWNIKQISRAYWDIEVASDGSFPHPETADQEVQSIAIYFENKDITYVLGTKDGYKPADKVKYIKVHDEKELISHFWSLVNHDVCVLVGWNTSGFDIPYLINRSENIGIDLKELLPFGRHRKTMERVCMNETYEIPGLICYDYVPLLKKFMANEPMESYTLDYSGKYFLGEGKVEHHGESLMDLYDRDYQKFIEYNIKDVMLVYEIEKKKKLVELVIGIALKAKVNLNEVFSPVKLWDNMIYNKLIKNKIVVQRKPMQLEDDEEGDNLEGAYVLDPVRGMHDWIASFDFGSLYPNIMISWNMSKQTLLRGNEFSPALKKIKQQIDEANQIGVTDSGENYLVQQFVDENIDLSILKQEKVSVSGAGHFFHTDKPDLICDIVNDIYAERKSVQKKAGEIKDKFGENEEFNQLENLSWALKILINSYYGICANKYFRFYSFEVAESVTKSGQVMIKSIRKGLNEFYEERFGHKDAIKQGDTDSIYITMKPILDAYEQKIGKTLSMAERVDFIKGAIEKVVQPKVASLVSGKLNYMNTLKQTLKMNYEKLSVAAIIVQKKKYLLSVVDDGKKLYIDNPKLSVKGVEIVRTNTPQVIRDELKSCVNHIFQHRDNELLRQHVKKYRDEVYMKLTYEQIARPTGVSQIKKFRDKKTLFKSKTPMHVRASILYNYLITKHKLTNKYEIIGEGNKIKHVYLKMPNPLHQDVIGFPNGINLPTEFGLDKYVDYKTQFEKTFLSPLTLILESMGWELHNDLRKNVSLF